MARLQFLMIVIDRRLPPVPPWEPDPKRDVEACDAVGDDVKLMLDCWHYFSREQALFLGR